jgi:hypothetical protein
LNDFRNPRTVIAEVGILMPFIPFKTIIGNDSKNGAGHRATKSFA